MKSPIGLALLAIGGLFLFFAYRAMESPASQISEAFTGSPTDRAIGFLVLGIGFLGAGACFFLGGKKKR